MKREDITKAVLVFVAGLTLAFDLCYYHPASAKEVEHMPAFMLGSKQSETNSIPHLPHVRIGSGIR
jgi:hypothetical protein